MGKEGLLHVVRGSHPELEDRSAGEAGPENGPPAARVQSAGPGLLGLESPTQFPLWNRTRAPGCVEGFAGGKLRHHVSPHLWPFTMGLDPTGQARALQPGVPTPDLSHPQGPCSHFRDEKIEAETDQSSDKSHSHQQVAGLELEVGLPFPVLP